MIENLIIGSGPSGLAAAHKLLSLGYSVKMIDGGDDLPVHINEKIMTLNQNRFISWNQANINSYQNLTQVDERLKSHVGSKLLFGSSFAYLSYDALASNRIKIESDLNVFQSMAVGGLSRVWGSLCFPYTNSELLRLDPQIEREDYEYVSEFMEVAGKLDDLSNIYNFGPLASKPIVFSNLSQKLENLYGKTKWFDEKLVLGGLPRIAVQVSGITACQSCGLCATGCPWGSIWDAGSALNKLRSRKNFEYQTGFRVEGISPISNGYKVTNFKGDEIIARRVFVAAGPIGSTILLLRNGLIPSYAKLDDTQLSIIPCIALHKKQSSRNFVLSQFILNFQNDVGVTSEFVQITGYNPDLVRRVRGYIPFLKYFPAVLLDKIFRYLAIAMVFQNTNDSNKVRFELIEKKIHITSDKSKKISVANSNNFKLIIQSLRKLRLIPLVKFIQVVGVGESYHLGNLTDIENKKILGPLGEVPGYENLHVVDSSSLAHIAAGSVTYTSMAHAVHIVEELHKK